MNDQQKQSINIVESNLERLRREIQAIRMSITLDEWRKHDHEEMETLMIEAAVLLKHADPPSMATGMERDRWSAQRDALIQRLEADHEN